MTKAYNDMLLAADGGQMTELCLLELTAAFDTVDHNLLLLRLGRQFGIHCVALQWFCFVHICRADRSMLSTVVPRRQRFTLFAPYYNARFLVCVRSFRTRQT